MQRFVLAVAIFFLIITLSFVSLFYVTKSCEELQSEIDTIISYIEKNDFQNGLKGCEDFSKKWDKTERFIITLVRHDNIDEVTIKSKRMLGFAKSNDKSNLLAEAYALKTLINHIREDELPLLHNFL